MSKRVTVRRATVSLEEHPLSARCQLPNKVQVVSVLAMEAGYIGGRRYNFTVLQPQYYVDGGKRVPPRRGRFTPR
jgi:hypothetical protein